MTPSFSTKKGARYRYYHCRLLIEGRGNEAGAIRRVSAFEVECNVATTLAGLKDIPLSQDEIAISGDTVRQLVSQMVDRVVLSDGCIRIRLTPEAASAYNQQDIDIPWVKQPSHPKREILLPYTDPSKDGRPIRAEVRTSVVHAVALGRAWLNQLVSGQVKDTQAIADREGRSRRSVHMTISLAFVAPKIIEALIAGRLPRGIGITRLADLPLDWTRQYQVLGLSNQSLGTPEGS